MWEAGRASEVESVETVLGVLSRFQGRNVLFWSHYRQLCQKSISFVERPSDTRGFHGNVWFWFQEPLLGGGRLRSTPEETSGTEHV